MGRDEFVAAVKAGDTARMERLATADPALVAAAGPSGESALMTALYNRQPDAAGWLVAHGAPIDIFAAAALGRGDLLEPLIATGGAVAAQSADGWTPLHLAAFFGSRDAVAQLVAAGADLNA
ncbi:MAG: ankyrin repeat domain-containing protein, partial [Acidobacteriota bacterium]